MYPLQIVQQQLFKMSKEIFLFNFISHKFDLTLVQESGNGKLGLAEFATLWKKIQKYLVSLS